MNQFGYYSGMAVDDFRKGKIVLQAGIWRTPIGEEVVVTYVGSTRNPADSGYYWSDARCVGEVVEYIGPCPDGDARLYGWDTFLKKEQE